jgi:IS30 family transposase
MAQQLTMYEREIISQARFAGLSQADIARRVGRSASTVSRELARNSTTDGYSAVTAHSLARQRRSRRPLVRKLQRRELNEYVRRKLVQRWSPDQIAGRRRREYSRDRRQWVCAQTIYRWIATQPAEDRRHWEQFLRFKGRRKPQNDRRGRLPQTVHVRQRPRVVDRRARYGDWEGDTIVGRRHSGGIVTLVERKSGYLLAGKVPSREAGRVRRAIGRLYQQIPARLRRTLTLDNGKEFAEHAELSAELDLSVYFAEPRCPWQRGSNEHTNGLVRQYCPKGTDFREVSRHTLEHIRQQLNDRPRQRLKYQTPNEVFSSRIAVAIEK